MTGKTKVIKEELTLTCDSLHFDSPNDILKTFGSTHIWDKDYDLFSDSLNYFTELNRGEALGNARLKQKTKMKVKYQQSDSLRKTKKCKYINTKQKTMKKLLIVMLFPTRR